MFQADHGGEFIDPFINHLTQCGIYQKNSCPVTQDQNGVTEWKHGYIIKMGITLLDQAKMDKPY